MMVQGRRKDIGALVGPLLPYVVPGYAQLQMLKSAASMGAKAAATLLVLPPLLMAGWKSLRTAGVEESAKLVGGLLTGDGSEYDVHDAVIRVTEDLRRVAKTVLHQDVTPDMTDGEIEDIASTFCAAVVTEADISVGARPVQGNPLQIAQRYVLRVINKTRVGLASSSRKSLDGHIKALIFVLYGGKTGEGSYTTSGRRRARVILDALATAPIQRLVAERTVLSNNRLCKAMLLIMCLLGAGRLFGWDVLGGVVARSGA